MQYIFYFIISAFLSFLFVSVIRKLALRFNFVDKPDEDRKKHPNPVPLMGGLGIFLVFFLMLFLNQDKILSGNLDIGHWLGFLAGGIVLMIGGFLDDKYRFKASAQFMFPVLAIVLVLIGGIEISKISNPFGGYLYFSKLLSNIFLFIWLMGMMYTTKLLDGVDGLVSGVVGIGAFVIFLFTMTTKYYQPDIGFASLILSAACLGFLVLNWHPAKIFLGEGASLFLGYALGVLAIISGGKIAIALLVMGIPIMDVFWIIIRRLREGKNPFKFADRKHLHYRLIDLGLSPVKTVLFYYLISTMFGLSALFLQSMGKVMTIGFLVLFMLSLVLFFRYIDKRVDKNIL